jgi:hypothetical protein
VILASSWPTRWEMGALEPTQGQAASAAGPAGAALAGWTAPAREAATVRPARDAAAVISVRARAVVAVPAMSAAGIVGARRPIGLPHAPARPKLDGG